MELSAVYICPRRGLASLEPPEVQALRRASSAAREMGLERLILGVPEEALSVSRRNKVDYFDGLVRALDQLGDSGLLAWLLAPAHELLGVIWAPPYLIRPIPSAQFRPVFVDRKLRSLKPYTWWADPALLQKRIRLFAELADAVLGHPALRGWVAMDGILDGEPPDPPSADFFLKALLAAIRERDEKVAVWVRLDWRALEARGLEGQLAAQAEGVQLRTQGAVPRRFPPVPGPSGHLHLSAFAGTLARWLWKRPVHVELGWGIPAQPGGFEPFLEDAAALARAGLEGAVWPTLMDPQSSLRRSPPWNLDPTLAAQGLLLPDGIAKEGAAEWVEALRAGKPQADPCGFIDLGREEYLADPAEHLQRLWNRFKEAM